MATDRQIGGIAGAIDRAIAGWMGNENTLNHRAAAVMLSGAVVLGLLGDALFNHAGLGVNYPVWIAALVAVYLSSVRLTDGKLDLDRAGLLVLGLCCAAMVVWRGTEGLQAMSLLASLGCVCLAVAIPPAPGFRRLGILEFGLRSAGIGLAMMAGLPRPIMLFDVRKSLGRRAPANAFLVGRALVLTAPLVVGFGGLFVAADAVFEERVNALVQFDLAGIQTHVLWIAAFTWMAAGVLWSGVTVRAPVTMSVEVPESKRLQTLEVIVVVGSLVVLFAAFVVIQVRYLFSGEGPVEHSLHLTYAEYARRGFFELVAAAALLLPVLLAIDWAGEAKADVRCLSGARGRPAAAPFGRYAFGPRAHAGV